MVEKRSPDGGADGPFPTITSTADDSPPIRTRKKGGVWAETYRRSIYWFRRPDGKSHLCSRQLPQL